MVMYGIGEEDEKLMVKDALAVCYCFALLIVLLNKLESLSI